MIFREAILTDIPQMQVVRNAVKENVLSNPAMVPDKDYMVYMTERGKGWVCTVSASVVGFAIVDVVDSNIWALFVHPDFDRQGIGKQLHKRMMDWYFSHTNETVWLSTAPNSRAETFYRMNGWRETGIYGKGEIRFEMDAGDWLTATGSKQMAPLAGE
jgi:GNAT superfamily N-acetyltransferase